MKKNFRKAGPASLTLLFATVLAAALVFAGCSSSSGDSGDSIKSSATVFEIVQTFTPEPGANFLTVELNGGSFKKDVSLSDFAFGQTRSSTFGTSLGGDVRLTKGNVAAVGTFDGVDGSSSSTEAGVLTKVYITGLSAAADGDKAGVQTLIIKASALAVQPVADTPAVPGGPIYFPSGVHIETGTTRPVVIGPFSVNVLDADVLTLALSVTNGAGGYSGLFVEKPLLSDFELLQKDGDRTGYYKAYDVAASGGFASLAGSEVVRDFPWEIRFNGLTKSVAATGGAYLLVKASAQAKQIGGTVSPVTTLLPDGSTPLYWASSATSAPKFSFGKSLTKDPQDWIGFVDSGKTSVTVIAQNAVFKPLGQLSKDYFVFDDVDGGFKKGSNMVITAWTAADPDATPPILASVTLSGLEAPTKAVEQRLTVLRGAFAYWNPTSTEDIDIDPVAPSGAPVIESAQYAMTTSNVLTLELPNGGQFVTAQSLAKTLSTRNSTSSKTVTYEADAIPAAESEGGVWAFVINMPNKWNSENSAVVNPNVSALFPGGTGTFANGIPTNVIIQRIRMSTDRSKMELYRTLSWSADQIDTAAVINQKSTLKVLSSIVEKSTGAGLSITSGVEPLKLPFTVGDAGANNLTVSVTIEGTAGTSLNGKLFNKNGRDWQTLTVVEQETRAVAATVPVRVASDATLLYGVIDPPLVAGNYLAVVGGELQSRIEAKTITVSALADGTGPKPLLGNLYVSALPPSLAAPYTRVWALAGNGSNVEAPLVSPVDATVAAPSKNGDNTLTVTLNGATFRGWAGYGAGNAPASQPQAYDVGSLVRVTDFSVDGTVLNAGKVILVNATTARIYDIKPVLGEGIANVGVKAEAILRSDPIVAPTGTASSALSVKVAGVKNTGVLNLVVTLDGGTWANDGAVPSLPTVAPISAFFNTVYESGDPAKYTGDTPDYIILDGAPGTGTPNLSMWGDNKEGTRLLVSGTPGNTISTVSLARSVKWTYSVYLTVPNVDGIIVREDGVPAKLAAKQQ